MGLTDFYSCPRAIERNRCGLLGVFQDGFCDWLIDKRYSKTTINSYIPHITHLSCFLSEQGLDNIQEIEKKHLHAYFEQPFSSNYLLVAHYAYGRFLRFLKEQGIDLVTPVQPIYQSLLDQYSHWCKNDKYLSPATIHLRQQYLIIFINRVGAQWFVDNLSQLKPRQIQTLFLDGSTDKGVRWRRSMAAALRSFFQFCHQKGLTQVPLFPAIPSISAYRLSILPKGITEQDANALLASIDRNTRVGKRNYAILRLLYDYGARNAQVRKLRLQDIDWVNETLSFKALKFGNPVRLPLLTKVGDALLDYLQHSRPKSQYPEVFLTHQAPFHPFPGSTNIDSIIFAQAQKANLNLPSCGSHMFRHGFATRLVNQAVSLKTIADLLGHKNIQTTLLYSKVDFIALNQVPLDFPEIRSAP